MSHRRGREVAILVGALATALAVPIAAARHLDQRVRRGLEPTLSRALGTSVEVGSIEASLTGAIRLEDVSVGSVFSARAVEGSVGMASLLAGQLRADEVRIERPHLRIRVDDQGHSNVERIVRNAAAARARAAGEAGGASAAGKSERRPPRVVVSDGQLVLEIGNRGALRLADVQLHPQTDGVRVVVGATTVDVDAGDWSVRGQFDRAAGDLSLPAVTFDRVLAVGGHLTVRPSRGAKTELSDVVFARRAGNGSEYRLTARVDRAGPDARLTAIAPTEGDAAESLVVSGQNMPLSSLAPLFPASFELDRTLATGRAALSSHGERGYSVQLLADIQEMTIDDRRLAQVPVVWSGRAELSAEIRNRGVDREINLSRLEVTSGDLRAEVSAQFRWPRGASFPAQGEVRASIPRTSCMDALTSLPTPLRDRLSGIAARGQASAAVRIDFDADDLDATRLDLDVDVRNCRITREASHADPRSLTSPFEHTFPNGETRRIGLGVGDYAPLRSLPGYVDGAFVAAEDARFFAHSGFDARQIERSLAVNLQQRAIVRGGSTISQQLVKNVFLVHDRSLARKLQEAILTWRLEQHLSKRMILERYLNIIELGDGVYGIPAAARYWFAKTPRELNVAEAAFLAALTPSPRTTSTRIRDAGGLDRETKQKVRTVLRHMRRAGVIDENAYRRARDAEVVLRTPLLAGL